MPRRIVSVLLALLPLLSSAQEPPRPQGISAKVDQTGAGVRVEYSASVPSDAVVELECRMLTSVKDLGKRSDDKPQGLGSTVLAFSLPDLGATVETLRCVVLSRTNAVIASPAFDVDVANPRKLYALEAERIGRDAKEGEKYSPPSRLLFDRFERTGKNVTLYLKTISPGQVKGRIIGRDGEVGPTTLHFEHALPFQNLEPGKTYRFEVWVVDAANKPVESSRATSFDGVPLEYPMPSDPGKPGLTIGKPGKEGSVDQVTARDATITVTADRDADAEVRFTKVRDRKRGDFVPGPSKTISLEKDRPIAVTIPLDAGTEYDFEVVARSTYGDTARRGPLNLTTLKEFGFEKPVEISLTPVGFLIKAIATEKPDRAGVILTGKGYELKAEAKQIENETVTMALTTDKLRSFATEFADVPEEQRRSIWQKFTGKQPATATAPASVDWPTIEVYVGRGTDADVKRSFKVALESVDSTKEKIKTLNLPEEDRTKLSNAAGEAAKQRWGDSWGTIIEAIIRIGLTAL